jgi:hypothetical protein
VGHIPGLAVVKALSSDGEGEAVTTAFVEVYMYPGDGQVIITSALVSIGFQYSLCLVPTTMDCD